MAGLFFGSEMSRLIQYHRYIQEQYKNLRQLKMYHTPTSFTGLRTDFYIGIIQIIEDPFYGVHCIGWYIGPWRAWQNDPGKAWGIPGRAELSTNPPPSCTMTSETSHRRRRRRHHHQVQQQLRRRRSRRRRRLTVLSKKKNNNNKSKRFGRAGEDWILPLREVAYLA